MWRLPSIPSQHLHIGQSTSNQVTPSFSPQPSPSRHSTRGSLRRHSTRVRWSLYKTPRGARGWTPTKAWLCPPGKVLSHGLGKGKQPTWEGPAVGRKRLFPSSRARVINSWHFCSAAAQLSSDGAALPRRHLSRLGSRPGAPAGRAHREATAHWNTTRNPPNLSPHPPGRRGWRPLSHAPGIARSLHSSSSRTCSTEGQGPGKPHRVHKSSVTEQDV